MNCCRLCEKRGAAVVIGGGLNSGILATGAVPGAKYNYSPAPEHIMEKVRQIEAGVQGSQGAASGRRPAVPAGPSQPSHRMCRARAR